MSAIDNYGEFEMPEEKSMIEVVEDLVKTILSIYDMFKKENINSLKLLDSHEELAEEIYKKGIKLFEEKEELNADDKQMKAIIEKLREKKQINHGIGLFLSTLINSTKINTLFIDEFPDLDYIGYWLKKNKTIILGQESCAYSLGEKAKGGTTINFGRTDWQAAHSTGGNHINKVRIVWAQGFYATHGNYINQGVISIHKKYGHSTTKANHINLSTPKIESPSIIDLQNTTHPLKSQLEQKLSELDFLKTEEPEKLVQLFEAYDWNKFDKKLNEICEKIQEAYGRK